MRQFNASRCPAVAAINSALSSTLSGHPIAPAAPQGQGHGSSALTCSGDGTQGRNPSALWTARLSPSRKASIARGVTRCSCALLLRRFTNISSSPSAIQTFEPPTGG